VNSSSVTTWIEQVKAGDPVAGQRLWERYLTRLVEVARSQLAGSPQQVADAADVVVVAFEKFLRYSREGRFPRLEDRYDLWQLLLVVTERVALDQRRKVLATKRGGRVTNSIAARPASIDESGSHWQPESREPSPEFAVSAAEECRRLLRLLNDDGLQSIALAKVQGLSNEEIATQQAMSVRSVERKLNIIRKIWIHELRA
jgi:RNA polymerase sigma factor (sigma-70 family)